MKWLALLAAAAIAYELYKQQAELKAAAAAMIAKIQAAGGIRTGINQGGDTATEERGGQVLIGGGTRRVIYLL